MAARVAQEQRLRLLDRQSLTLAAAAVRLLGRELAAQAAVVAAALAEMPELLEQTAQQILVAAVAVAATMLAVPKLAAQAALAL
jgi:histone H3/H4